MEQATIYYTKQFTGGTLKGLSYITNITFPKSQTDEMVQWLQSHKVKPNKSLMGCSPWIVTDMSFQNYKR